ncbi:PLDc N-terminal domain-containing protein [Polaribacter vadi]|uniref:PLDc N-terminal domain-containing protein n=1 Tax=Polaribacter vadi TaxID=1774273 RepID=UPI003C6E8D8F
MLIGLFVLSTILWLQAIIDIVKTTFKRKIYKIIWICIVFFFPIIGSLIYFNLKKRNKRRKFQPNFDKTQRPDRF